MGSNNREFRTASVTAAADLIIRELKLGPFVADMAL